jgi:hypothetical protein
LEGFCSTIELHPRTAANATAAMKASTGELGLTNPKPLPYQRNRMTHLNAIAAAETANRWWRGYSHAERWPD